jgi:hypothetical protein
MHELITTLFGSMHTSSMHIQPCKCMLGIMGQLLLKRGSCYIMLLPG